MTCKVLMGVAVVLITGFLQSPGAWASPGDPVRGKKVFEGWCIQCHGVHGNGKGIAAPALMDKPANFTDPSIWNQKDDFYINIIKNGKNVMPPFWDVLTDQQVRDVLSYEKTFKKK